MLDDARYNDETGTAPIPTGYSEVVFGELFRAAGWERDQVVVCNKLWWEFWPEQSAERGARRFARAGWVSTTSISSTPSIHRPSLSIETVVEQVAGLIESGRARAWGTGMWTAAQHHAALDVCERTGAPAPCAAQMATSLVDHAGPDDPAMRHAFDRGPIGLVASYVLAGGTLTGKYDRGESGRADHDANPVIARGKRLAAGVAALATDWAVPPSHVAFAYAFQHPSLATVLFGSSSPEQLRENVDAWATFERLDNDQLAAVRQLAETDDA